MAELADAHGLGPCGKPWGFNSLRPHHRTTRIRSQTLDARVRCAAPELLYSVGEWCCANKHQSFTKIIYLNMAKLNQQQSDYIRNNIDKKSKRKIAKELGIDKRLVSKYLKGLNIESGPSYPERNRISEFFEKIFPHISLKKWTSIHIFFIFIIAFVIRIIYVYQLSHTYFFKPFAGGLDDYIFDNWAQQILNGNWLGDKIIYIYRMPLYVYFLSFVYFLCGHSYWAVYIIQSFIGSLACILVYLIGRVYFNKSVGLIAAIITALYGPLLFYNGMLVGETICVFTTCLSFLFLLLFQKKQKWYLLFFAGIFIGLSMLARGNMLIVLPFIFIWLLMFFRKEILIKLCLYVFILSIGVVTAVLPIIIRNYICEKDFVPITALGGLNIYIGNAFGANGQYRTVERIGGQAEGMIKNSIEIAEKSVGKKLKPSQVSNYWMKKTMRSIGEHGIKVFAMLLWKKTVLFWSSYEISDIWDYYFFKNYIPMLNFPFFSFLIIMPLAIAGAYLNWPKRHEFSLLYTFLLGYMFSLVAVFITSRYRLQVVPFLSILAAYTITQIKNIFWKGQNKIIICVIILIGAIIFSNLPIKKEGFETSYNGLAILLKRSGKIEEAIKVYNKAIEIAPRFPYPYYNLGILYRDIGQDDLAASYFKKTIEIDPYYTEARDELEAWRRLNFFRTRNIGLHQKPGS